ncbi:C4-dicarboxylate TRAP transporter substrate-binding protein [Halovulum dunhuangense]|uniref:C4-dicarboxylate TRAP transporter substrate-binding protein n=1 Tax=Halovulum dunhuangense TaxID=1505036 RepID=A0A849L7H6_9RHOB|nr:C4-dicarboxylate TRAP transporter substrate-binding protein [Halovulum dunhuangense]NNU82050.1 C4-dicarboxylate TRAP transporter substrate-binding protein [Halovulum dunhuangense]
MKTRNACKALSGVSLLAMLAAGPSFAQEEISIRIASGFAPNVAAVKILQETFMPRVDERLAETGNYSIEWREAFSGTLAQPGGELEAIQLGLTDIGVIPTAFHADRLPLYQIGSVTPFTSSDLVLIFGVMDDLVEQYQEFSETWDPLNQVSLAVSGIPDNYVLCSRVPISTKEDVDGLRVAGAGLNLRWVEPAGAVGVTGTLANFYQLVETGVADAMMVWGEAIVSLKYHEVCPHYFDAGMGGLNSYVINVNKQAWDRYPEEVRTALREAAVEYGVAIGNFSAEVGAQARDTMLESGGTVTELSQEDRLAWVNSLPPLAIEWADALEGEGVRAREILAAYMEAMREADQPVLRDWDVE